MTKVDLPNTEPQQYERFEFSFLRSDWYRANSAMPRMIRQCMAHERSREFVGFPRQWIPFFEWWGVRWSKATKPAEHIPFFSDLTQAQLAQVVNRARKNRCLRLLVEAAAVCDPLLADALYIVDHTARADSPAARQELAESETAPDVGKPKPLVISGWQAYGRPSVRKIERIVQQIEPQSNVAVVLPCTSTRPYDKSPTHRRIYRLLELHGFVLHDIHRIVVAALGVLPEEVWRLPQVMAYDTGVPDVYRTLRLIRSYFGRIKYRDVLDCLTFEPYRDLLQIAKREGIIMNLRRIKPPGRSRFFLRA